MAVAAGEQVLLLAARLDIDEGGVQKDFAAVGVLAFDAGALQHVLAVAGRMLRMGARVLQALDAQRQQQPVFVGDRVVGEGIGLGRALQRHPVVAVLGEQGQPVVEAAGVEQRGLGGDEVFRRRHAAAAMYFAQARNWLRISSSLVPLVVMVDCCSSDGSKLRCRLTHSLPSARRPCCMLSNRWTSSWATTDIGEKTRRL